MKTNIFWAALVAVGFALPSAAGQPADTWITTKTKIALLADNGVDGTKINVDTSGGVVTLYGTLPDQAQHHRALDVAKSIEGVASVRDLLVVQDDVTPAKYTNSPRMAKSKAGNARLRKQVEAALDTSRLDGSSIKVSSVSNGDVVLTGRADSLSDQRIALARARSVPGVQRVTDNIVANDPDDTSSWQPRARKEDRTESRAGDAWITSAVKLRLLADEATPGLNINVDTDDGVVTLFGIVPTAESKAAAEAEATKVDDVAKVVNALQVVSEDRQVAVDRADAQAKLAVRASLNADDRLDDGNIDVEVSNGVARLTGTVASHDDRVLAAQRARAALGVRAVRQELNVKVTPPTTASN